MYPSIFFGQVSRLLIILTVGCVSAGDDVHPSEVLRNVNVLAALEDVSATLTCLNSALQDNLRISEKTSDRVDKIKVHVNEQTRSVDTLTNEVKQLITSEVLKLKQEIRHSRAISNISEVAELTATIMKLKSEIAERDEKVKQLQDSLLAERKANKMECQLQTREETSQLKKKLTEQVQDYNQNKNWKALRMALEKVLAPDSAAYKQLQDIKYEATNPLFRIGSEGKRELAEMLVSYGGAVNAMDAHGTTILYGAAYSGDVKMATWLLDHGADIEAGFTGGRTPLMNAAEQGHLQLVKHLVQAGANTMATNEDGYTPLDCARSRGQTDVVRYLSQLQH